jgi:protoporphyrinogen oxidase
MRIAILGGGFSGVILARILQEKGHEPHIFEAQESLGGLCSTKNLNGFIYDCSGGHMLYSDNEKALNYIFDATGGMKTWEKKSCNAKIYFNGDYIRYPFEAGLKDLPKDIHYECLMSYINASYDQKYLRKPVPTNLYDWLLYKFGKGIAYNFMIPYNQKKWNYNLKHINPDRVAEKIPSVPVEEVVKASIGIPTEACKHRMTFYYPKQGGFQFMINKMAEPIEHICIATPVKDLAKHQDKWIINETYEFDDVISTLALQELMYIIKNTPPFVSTTLASLWYNGVATVFLGLQTEFNHDYSWVYLPHKESGSVDSVTFLSSFSKHNAPAGCSSLLAEITYKAKSVPEKNEILIAHVVHSLHECGIIDRNDVIVSDSSFYKYGYPVYGLKFHEFSKIINNYLNELKLKRFGRFATHSYVNIDQLVEQAFESVNSWY